jgi:hypothetical protein
MAKLCHGSLTTLILAKLKEITFFDPQIQKNTKQEEFYEVPAIIKMWHKY